MTYAVTLCAAIAVVAAPVAARLARMGQTPIPRVMPTPDPYSEDARLENAKDRYVQGELDLSNFEILVGMILTDSELQARGTCVADIRNGVYIQYLLGQEPGRKPPTNPSNRSSY